MDRLQAMRVFARVAELGSFARAADALALSRARVSESIAALERALGARLVHRTTRHVALSDDGRAFYERVARILGDVDEAEAVVRRSRSVARGRLRIDMPMALARLFVVPALPRLLARHTQLELEIRIENRAIDLIQEGLDCAITYGAPTDTDLVAVRVGTTHLVTCASPAYLNRHPAPLTPRGLGSHNAIAFLSLPHARAADWRFERDGTPSTYRPRGNLAFNSMEACLDAAQAGLGMTQVLSSVAHKATSAGTLRPVLLDWAAEGPSLYVVYPPNRQQSARIRAFTDFASEVFAEADTGWKDLATPGARVRSPKRGAAPRSKPGNRPRPT